MYILNKLKTANLLFSTIALLAFVAFEIEPGKTYDADNLETMYEFLGHIQIAKMERNVFDDNDGKVYTLSHHVTAKPDLSKWYYIESSRDRSKSTVLGGGDEGLWINNIYTNNKRYHSSLKFDRSKFMDEAKTFAKDYGSTVTVGFYNDIIEDLEENLGYRIALQGASKANHLISVLVNPDTKDKEMVVLETMGQGGVTGKIALGRNFEFSSRAKAALGIDK
mgnify:CR=1 FL=1